MIRLQADGAGGFSPAEGSPISLPVIDANGASLVALDFNGDGKLDLAAAVYASIIGDNNVFVLLGDGQGEFSTTLDLQVQASFPGFPPSSIVAADFNGDTLPDLAATFFCSGQVQVLINPSPPPQITVAIDIKPGSFPNTINIRSGGKISVAILSATGFDAPAQVDPSSLTFGRTGNETSLAFCTKSSEDVNSDGLLDLVCHFKIETANFQLGDTQGILKGKTVLGRPIIGTDSIRIVN